jgi:regulation of enolase protein 1 (concanavalin A-like superfamily)
MSHYRIRRLLGEGGMGLVFYAEDTELLRPVALKVIRPELADKPEAAQRFLREARAMAAIKHDHIVTIYQVGQERGVSFLAMEYLRGMSLREWLDRGHRPAPDLVLRIGREIATGLVAAHKRRLIHRDIKPANIWLEAPGGRVKILDFGLARIESGAVEITRPGLAVGTPQYMAPELARGEGVGAASDLFSLGCVLYRLCAGRLPFEGETITAVLTALAMDTPRSPREIEPALPPALDALVMRLLAKDPADRPPSAAAVVEAMRSIERELLGERQRIELGVTGPLPTVAGPLKPARPVLAGEPGTPPREARARTARRALGIAVVALGIGAVLTGVFIFRRGAGTNAAARPSPTTAVAAGPSEAVGQSGARRSSPAPAVLPLTAETPAQARNKAAKATGDAAPVRVAKSQEPPPKQPARDVTAESIAKHQEISKSTAPPVPLELAKAKRQEIPAKEASSPRAEARKGITNSTAWGDAIDPDGDCRVVVEPTRVRIFVPGKPHILSAEIHGMNAPRILREVRGDFDARVSVAGVFHPAGRSTFKAYPSPYHGAGILLWQDEENYVRLEIAADVQRGKIRPYVNFEYRKDGTLAVSNGLKNDDSSSHLRLRRRGEEIYAAFGPDGVRWTSFPPLVVKINDRLKIGVTAINTATRPLEAQLDGFEVSENSSPGKAAGDGGSNAP